MIAAETLPGFSAEAVDPGAANSLPDSGRAAIVELTPDRALKESLVECFVATPGLGVARLRRLGRAVLEHGSRATGQAAGVDLASVLVRLAEGTPSPFPAFRRNASTWFEMSSLLQAAVAQAQSPSPSRSQSVQSLLSPPLPPAHRRWWMLGDPGWYAHFGTDDDAPAALSVLGSLRCLDEPRVAIVGTRSASAAGLAFARQLAGELAEAGVSVVSGLARGIDGAAHRGAVGAGPEGEHGPIGILGTGVAVAYPQEHRGLQRLVAERGVVLSEYSPLEGPRPEAFPQRNRIVAQLGEVVVVVESANRGGSLLTVDEAVLRGRPILAVPSNPLVRSAAGTNALLRPQLDQPAVALPCHGASDVLALLNVVQIQRPSYADPRVVPTARGMQVLNALGWDRRATSSLVSELAQPLSEVVRTLAELEDGRWVHHVDGRWVRRRA